MKILHIIDSGNLYGAEVMLLNLIEEQRRNGFIPILCNIGMNIKEEHSIDEEAIKRNIHFINIKFNKGFDINNALQLWEEAISMKINIIHSHSYKSDIIYGIIPKLFRKIPMITTIHGLTDKLKLRKLNIYDFISCNICRYIDAIVLVDKSMLNNYIFKNKKYKNIHVIENGISENNNNDINNELCSFLNLRRSNNIVIGSIGRLDNEKGYHILIEAIFLLKKSGWNIKAIIIGDGPERENLKKIIIEYNLLGDVFLLGYKRNAKIYLRLFDIFVSPSLREGFPITILEAMQAGIPIIATDVGGIPEMLQYGKAGILIKPNNVKLIIDSVINLIKDDSIKYNVSNVAKAIVKSNYSVDVMVKKYTSLYKNILNTQK